MLRLPGKDFFYGDRIVAGNNLGGDTVAEKALGLLPVPFGKFFFLDLGDGLVAVNLTAFKKIHFELLPGIALEPLLQKRARRVQEKYACIFLLPSRRRGRFMRLIYKSLRKKVLRLFPRERLESSHGHPEVFLQVLPGEYILQRHQGKRDFRRNLRNLLVPVDFPHVHDLQQERKADPVVVFGIVREHCLALDTPRILAVVKHNRQGRDVLLIPDHDLEPVSDQLLDKPGVRVALVLLDDPHEQFGLPRLLACDLDGKREVALPVGNRIAVGLGNFLQGVESHGLEELGEVPVLPCCKLQKFRRSRRVLKHGPHVRIMRKFFYHNVSSFGLGGESTNCSPGRVQTTVAFLKGGPALPHRHALFYGSAAFRSLSLPKGAANLVKPSLAPLAVIPAHHHVIPAQAGISLLVPRVSALACNDRCRETLEEAA